LTARGGLVAVATSWPRPQVAARFVLYGLTAAGRPDPRLGRDGALVADFKTDARAAAVVRTGRGV